MPGGGGPNLKREKVKGLAMERDFGDRQTRRVHPRGDIPLLKRGEKAPGWGREGFSDEKSKKTTLKGGAHLEKKKKKSGKGI